MSEPSGGRSTQRETRLFSRNWDLELGAVGGHVCQVIGQNLSKLLVFSCLLMCPRIGRFWRETQIVKLPIEGVARDAKHLRRQALVSMSLAKGLRDCPPFEIH